MKIERNNNSILAEKYLIYAKTSPLIKGAGCLKSIGKPGNQKSKNIDGFLDKGLPSLAINVICLVVFCVDFKVSLGVIAGGADFGSLSTDDDVTAVAAFPYLNFALSKNLLCFYVL